MDMIRLSIAAPLSLQNTALCIFGACCAPFYVFSEDPRGFIVRDKCSHNTPSDSSWHPMPLHCLLWWRRKGNLSGHSTDGIVILTGVHVDCCADASVDLSWLKLERGEFWNVSSQFLFQNMVGVILSVHLWRLTQEGWTTQWNTPSAACGLFFVLRPYFFPGTNHQGCMPLWVGLCILPHGEWVTKET